MQQGIKYKVTSLSTNTPIGYFIDNIYFEPFENPQRMGHLNNQGNLIYYLVKHGEKPSVRGRYKSGILTREDGFQFLVIPDA